MQYYDLCSWFRKIGVPWVKNAFPDKFEMPNLGKIKIFYHPLEIRRTTSSTLMEAINTLSDHCILLLRVDFAKSNT